LVRRVKLLTIDLYIKLQLFDQALTEINGLESQMRRESSDCGSENRDYGVSLSPCSSIGDIPDLVSTTEYELV
jgi:hypothetical protein